MVKASSVGKGIGGFFTSPFGLGIVGVAALGVGLFVFRDKISDFFQRSLDGLFNIELPEIALPDFTFPNIFIDNTSTIAGETVPFGDDGSTVTIPEDTIIDPITGIVTSSTPPILDLSEQARQEALRQLEINRRRSIAEQALSEIPIEEDISGAEFNAARNEAAFRARQQIAAPILSDQNVQTDIEGNQFSGGGLSFIGGSVTETPIRFLSLGQIIDRFDVSASKAADIRARAGGGIC